MRKCSHCNETMMEGYCIESGMAYYCTDECLESNMTREEFEDLWDDGEGDSHWTTWYDEEDE